MTMTFSVSKSNSESSMVIQGFKKSCQPKILHAAKVLMKCEDRIKTVPHKQCLYIFIAHVSFLRKPMKNVLYNKNNKPRKKKRIQDPENMGIQHKSKKNSLDDDE